MTPFNGTSDEMKAVGKYLREHGLYTMIANNSIHTNPPLCITEDAAGRGLRDHRRRPRHRRPGGRPAARRWRSTGARSTDSPPGRRPRPRPGAGGRDRRRHAVSSVRARIATVIVLFVARRPASSGRRSSSSAACRGGIRSVPGTASCRGPTVPLGLRQRPEPAALVEHRLARSAAAGPAQHARSPRPVPGRRRVLHWREAFIGFVSGRSSGSLLATVFVHSRLAERAFVPYVVASQTIPIVALAPMIVFAVGQNVASVVVIATYLTFFPVTIAMIRGLRSPDPRALELMRSYAAARWAIYRKVRLPASLPYLFTALKIAATAIDRRRDHRGGPGRHPGRPRPGDHQLQPAVHHRPREAVGGDLRVGHRSGRRSSSPSSASWSSSCCVAARARRDG